jgi:hypothetical protein
LSPYSHDSDLAANVISSLEFNPSGEYLASGDYGGSISIYKKKETVTKVQHTLSHHFLLVSSLSELTPPPPSLSRQSSVKDTEKLQNHNPWQPYCHFQSHDQEFDYLKSLEIEEKINHIEWNRPLGDSSFLFSTNGQSLPSSPLPLAESYTSPSHQIKLSNYGKLANEHHADKTLLLQIAQLPALFVRGSSPFLPEDSVRQVSWRPQKDAIRMLMLITSIPSAAIVTGRPSSVPMT